MNIPQHLVSRDRSQYDGPVHTEQPMLTLVGLLRHQQPLMQMTGDGWAAVIRAARKHHVLSHLSQSLQQLEIELPFIAARRLLRARQQDAASVLSTLLALKELLGIMASAGIRAVPLKGPVLLERLFGDAAIRPCQDIDLLIHPDEIDLAENVLRGLGYRSMAPKPSLTRDWIRHGVMVELHVHPHHRCYFDAPITSIWKRVRQAKFQGQPIGLLAPADELISLCVHAACHRYDRLSMTVELAVAFEVLGHHVGSCLPDGYKAESVSGIIQLGYAMVERLNGTPAIRESLPIELHPEVKGRAIPLSQRIWLSVLSESSPKHIEWELLRLLLQLEPTLTGKLRPCCAHLPIILSRVTQRDNELASSLGLRDHGAALLIRQIRLVWMLSNLVGQRLQAVFLVCYTLVRVKGERMQ